MDSWQRIGGNMRGLRNELEDEYELGKIQTINLSHGLRQFFCSN